MELKPCPFCGSKTVDGMITHSNECFIHKLIYEHPVGAIIEAWQIRATDPLLNEMAEELSQIVEEVKKHAYNPSLEHMGPLVLDSESVLQKYHEQVGDTNAG